MGCTSKRLLDKEEGEVNSLDQKRAGRWGCLAARDGNGDQDKRARRRQGKQGEGWGTWRSRQVVSGPKSVVSAEPTCERCRLAQGAVVSGREGPRQYGAEG